MDNPALGVIPSTVIITTTSGNDSTSGPDRSLDELSQAVTDGFVVSTTADGWTGDWKVTFVPTNAGTYTLETWCLGYNEPGAWVFNDHPTLTVTGSTAAGTINGVGSATVVRGQVVVVAGKGFDPNEWVEYTLHSTPVALGKWQADSAGDVSASITIPASVALGAHTITMTGLDSGRVVTVKLDVVTAASGGGTSVPAGGTGIGD